MLGSPFWVRPGPYRPRFRPILFQGIVIEGGASVSFINRSKHILNPFLEVPLTIHSGSRQGK